MAGEDFAFIGRAVPACFLFLGTRNESVGAGAQWGSLQLCDSWAAWLGWIWLLRRARLAGCRK